MPERAQRLVVVLYEHPLLGEGIARMLLVETDAEVALAPAGDSRAVRAALARNPSVVIFERGRCQLDELRLAPHAILIDVSAAMSTGKGTGKDIGKDTGKDTGKDVPAAPADLEAIILAVRGSEAAARPVDTGRPARRRR